MFFEPKILLLLFLIVIKSISIHKTHNKHFGANHGVGLYMTYVLCRPMK